MRIRITMDFVLIEDIWLVTLFCLWFIYVSIFYSNRNICSILNLFKNLHYEPLFRDFKSSAALLRMLIVYLSAWV